MSDMEHVEYSYEGNFDAKEEYENVNENTDEIREVHDNNENTNEAMIHNTANTKEVATIWELEVWKKSEQTKFKAYLKQIEIDYMNKIADDGQVREDKREKEFKSSLTELQALVNKTKKKAIELEARENKIILIEEEIKLKLNEISKQITNKNEEVQLTTKKFKDEKVILDKEIQNLKKQLQQKQVEIEDLENSFRLYRKEVDESPISYLKMEINKKAIEIEDSNKEKVRLANEISKLKQSNNRLKEDLISLKKAHDVEKEGLYKQKLEEIEKLKFEIYNQKQTNMEINELTKVKEALNDIKIKENNKINEYAQPPIKTKQYRIVSLENMHPRNYESKTAYGINEKNERQPESFEDFRAAELERLSLNRNQLMATGMYSESDKLICDLDNQIRKLLHNQ